MKGYITVINIVGQDIATLPIVDVTLKDGCVVVTAMGEGPFNLPANGSVRILDLGRKPVMFGTWDIGEGMEVAARAFGTVVLPVTLLGTK